MNRKFIALTAAVAALALPAASFAQSATSGSSTTTAPAVKLGHGRHHPPFDAIAKELGLDVATVKVRMFTLASLFCAVAGVGLAYYVGVLVPEGAGVNRSLEYVGTLLLGGAGSMLGPIVGAALVQWLFVVAGYGKQFELLLYGAAFLGAVR
jgi:phage shock protein PspC (stress-responsive transcriptional regulator)